MKTQTLPQILQIPLNVDLEDFVDYQISVPGNAKHRVCVLQIVSLLNNILCLEMTLMI